MADTLSDDELSALRDVTSVALFIDRAREAFPEFRLMQRNAHAVAEICRRLDGIPLAIELAASRIAVLTPARLLEHLDDRFGLLVSRHRDADPRHRALDTAIEWTVRLLDEADQGAFAELSVFRGGFSMEAVAAVCSVRRAVAGAEAGSHRNIRNIRAMRAMGAMGAIGAKRADGTLDALEVVSRLIDASLITVDDGAVERRFRMLESLRAYGAGLLGPERTAALQERHATWMLDLAERAAPNLSGPEQAAWMDRLDVERENLRAALDWCLEAGEVETGLGIGGSVWRYWFLRGALREGRRWLERLVEAAHAPGLPAAEHIQPHDDVDVVTLGLHALGTLAHMCGDHEVAKGYLSTCLERARRAGDLRAEARALNNLAMIAQARGDHDGARARYLESLAVKRRLGDIAGTVSTLKNLAGLASSQSDPMLARQLAEECLEIAEATADSWHIANGAKQMATVVLAFGDLALARGLLEKAVACFRAVGDRRSEANTLNYLADVAVNEADLVAAHSRAVESEAIYAALDNSAGLAESELVRGQISYFAGDFDDAHRRFERSLALRHADGEGLVGLLRAIWLAKTEIRLGRAGVAAERLDAAIEVAERLDVALILCTALDATAQWAAIGGDDRLAMTLVGAVDAKREALGCPRLPAFAREIDALVADFEVTGNGRTLAEARASGRAITLALAVKHARAALRGRAHGAMPPADAATYN